MFRPISTRSSQGKFPVKIAVCCRGRLLSYGVFDCEFDVGSHEWSCAETNRQAILQRHSRAKPPVTKTRTARLQVFAALDHTEVEEGGVAAWRAATITAGYASAQANVRAVSALVAQFAMLQVCHTQPPHVSVSFMQYLFAPDGVYCPVI